MDICFPLVHLSSAVIYGGLGTGVSAASTNSEWLNENRYRNYPFIDDVIPVIPEGLFIDAALYPRSAVGSLYLSEISNSRNEAVITDADGDLRLTAILGETLTFFDAQGVFAGTILASEDVRNVIAGDNSYSIQQTEFVPTAIFAVQQAGVEAFILPDGSRVSGDVTFQGANGIVISNPDPKVMRIDAVGTPENIEAGPIIKNIVLQQGSYCGLIAVTAGGFIEIGTLFQMNDVCSTRKYIPSEGELPYQPIDMCTTPAPGPPPYECPPLPPIASSPGHDGRVFITSVSSALRIKPLPNAGMTPELGEIVEDIEDQLPPRVMQGLMFMMRARL